MHQRASADERFVQVAAAAVAAMVIEHHLSRKHLGVLVGLVLLADDRDWVVRGWTLERLGRQLGTGHDTLRACLERLAEVGLVRWAPHRGACADLAVPGAVAIVVSGAPARPKDRNERRQLAREAALVLPTLGGRRGRRRPGGRAGAALIGASQRAPPSPAFGAPPAASVREVAGLTTGDFEHGGKAPHRGA